MSDVIDCEQATLSAPMPTHSLRGTVTATWIGYGIPANVTVNDVERLEGPAVGHIGYADKLALYVAEHVVSL